MLFHSSSSSFISKNEAKYHMLRTQLEKLHIISPIDYKSLDAIELMLNEILSLKRKFNNTSALLVDLEERNGSQALTIKAYKHQNIELFNQNKELHNEILSLLEKGHYQGKDIEFKRLNDDTNALQYLLIAAKEKNQQYQSELVELKQKYLELIISPNKNRPIKENIFEETIDNDINDNTVFQQRSNIESPLRNTNSQYNSNATSLLKYSNTNISNKMKATNQEMIEKILKLETELNEKNKEIVSLKKNINIDQKVVIDYLKNELEVRKGKYESYLQFQINKESNNSITHTHTHNRPNSTKQSINKKQARSKLISDTFIPQSNIKATLDEVNKENNILKEELEKLIDRLSIREQFFNAEIERNKINTKALKEYQNNNQHKDNINTIITLNEKLKDIAADNKSSKQNSKSLINEYNKKYNIMQQQINSLNSKIKLKEDECGKYKETINILNKKLYQFTSKTERLI